MCASSIEGSMFELSVYFSLHQKDQSFLLCFESHFADESMHAETVLEDNSKDLQV